MTQFYGFDWQQAPSYSRLFSPNVMQRAQSAYGQGMGQFTAYDPAQLEKLKAEQQARLAAANAAKSANINPNFMVGPDGRVYDITSKNLANQYGINNPNVRDGSNTPSQINYILKKYGSSYLPNLGWKSLTGA